LVSTLQEHIGVQPHIPTSVALARLLNEAPQYGSLGWLFGRLQKRSFAFVMPASRSGTCNRTATPPTINYLALPWDKRNKKLAFKPNAKISRVIVAMTTASMVQPLIAAGHGTTG